MTALHEITFHGGPFNNESFVTPWLPKISWRNPDNISQQLSTQSPVHMYSQVVHKPIVIGTLRLGIDIRNKLNEIKIANKLIDFFQANVDAEYLSKIDVSRFARMTDYHIPSYTLPVGKPINFHEFTIKIDVHVNKYDDDIEISKAMSLVMGNREYIECSKCNCWEIQLSPRLEFNNLDAHNILMFKIDFDGSISEHSS